MYTDKDQVDIAKRQYRYYNVDDEMKVNGHFIGIVKDVITDDTGLKVYVVEDPKTKHVTVLYRGSEGPGKPGSKVDWMGNDFPMGKNIITRNQEVTPQLQSAAKALNKIVKDYPGQITIYAHSLGSMNAQYAMAKVSDPSRIDGAYIYQGPNIYEALTPEEKRQVDSMKYRIHNYIDPADVVPIGYKIKDQRSRLSSKDAVGIVYQVNSKYVGLVDQHMWGGYQWNADGSLRLVKDDTRDFELRYGQPLDTAYMTNYLLSQYRTKMAKGGLSSNEEIFLDATQATAFAKSLREAAEIGHEWIDKLSSQANTEAEDLYQQIQTHRPWGFISDTVEILSAYQEAGVTNRTIVEHIERLTEEKTADSKAIHQAFAEMEATIQIGIDKKIREDRELAKDFETWNNWTI